jgi:hypothetical protein
MLQKHIANDFSNAIPFRNAKSGLRVWAWIYCENGRFRNTEFLAQAEAVNLIREMVLERGEQK